MSIAPIARALSPTAAYERPVFAPETVDRLLELDRERNPERALARLRTDFARLIAETDTPGRPGLLLSGGVDSALLLALLVEAGVEPICFTAGLPDSADLVAAAEVADAFGVELIPCTFDSSLVLPRLRAVARELRFGGLYALASGLLLDVCLHEARARGIEVAWAANGLDMPFGGAMDPTPFGTPDAVGVDERYWTYALDLIRRGHAQPDAVNVYGTLGAGRGIRFALPFERWGAVEAAAHVDASLLFRDGQDKWIVRQLAERMGVPSRIAVKGQHPFQRSSGMLAAIREAMYEVVMSWCPDHLRADFSAQDDPDVDLRCFVQLVADRAVDAPASQARPPRPRR